MSDRKLINQAASDPEHYVLRVVYKGKDGARTRRLISPYEIKGKYVTALCLCREMARKFAMSRLSEVELVPAHTVLMPETIETLTPAVTDAAHKAG